ncbi:hypothetical protein DE146DRAFT_363538 [Phaeosphaeria sp. MPI-PUGE-AT-0046c]|nr:hypothetical protein DE146DRAFT_363538 [Phaeosphaeria sp. MPI-PUGE-AT-0046c]
MMPKREVADPDGAMSQVAPSDASRDLITARNQRESRLLQMPAEIRNSIYTYALGGHAFKFLWPKRIRGSQSTQPTYTLALPRVCRQIHTEASLVVFAANDFFLDLEPPDGGTSLAFLKERSTAELESMQSCTLFYGYRTYDSSVFAMMPNLRSLRLFRENVYFMLSINHDAIEVAYLPFFPAPEHKLEIILQEMAAWMETWKPQTTFTIRRAKRMPPKSVAQRNKLLKPSWNE